MKLLTIFTPTYNRAHTLGRTYQSLCEQTCKDFIWLVVDDGSTDGTKELVNSFMKESIIEIRYVYQQNQGMHGAHNTAYRNIVTELNTCIDSDDYMPTDGVEKIKYFWEQNRDGRYAGFIGLDVDQKTKQVIGSMFPKDLKETTLSDYYQNGGKGDKKLVYRSKVTNQYPEYPLFKGEKYVGLAYKYMLIDQDYKLLTLNEPLVVVEYQSDGSSVQMWKQYWNNPHGFAFFRRTEMTTTKSFKRRMVSCVHYISSCIISRENGFVKQSPYPLMTFALMPMGYLLYRIIKHKVEGDKSFKF